ncbi:universal stress protein [Lactococcus lactis]
MVEEYKNILVAVDGSEQAYDALREAVDTAKLNHSHLKILYVTDKYITVEKDQFTKKSVKRDDFRIVKINGRYHACELFDRVVK